VDELERQSLQIEWDEHGVRAGGPMSWSRASEGRPVEESLP
jgi:hypothetical protein